MIAQSVSLLSHPTHVRTHVRTGSRSLHRSPALPTTCSAMPTPTHHVSTHPDAVRRRQEAEARCVASANVTRGSTLESNGNIYPIQGQAATHSFALTYRKRQRMMMARQPSFKLTADKLPANAQFITALDDALDTFTNDIATCTGDKLTVLFYSAPWCPGCKRLYPKFVQIANNNPEVAFKVVCVGDDHLRTWAQDVLGVAKLPYFQLYVEGALVSAFSANLTSINVVRAEIAAHTPCTDQFCSTN